MGVIPVKMKAKLVVMGFLLAIILLAVVHASSTTIQPEEEYTSTVNLTKGEVVIWSWLSSPHTLDFWITDPESDNFYELSSVMDGDGTFTTTISGDWTFGWQNPHVSGQTIDYSTILDYNITILNSPPTAYIQAEPTSGVGYVNVNLNGTGIDIDGYIVKYDWDLGDGTSSDQKELVHNYTSPGTYIVNLTVTDDDDATNFTTQAIIVYPEIPIIVGSSIQSGATDLPIETKVEVEFSLPMDKTDVQARTNISPSVDMEFVWTNNDKYVTIGFNTLSYSTAYSLTLGKAKAINGEALEHDLTLTFTTKAEPKNPTITITSPAPGDKFIVGDKIIIAGSTTDILSGEKVQIKIGSTNKDAIIGSDGKFTHEFTATNEGAISIAVSYGEVTVTVDITVDKKSEPTGPSIILWIIIAIVLTLIFIIAIVLLLKRKKVGDNSAIAPEGQESEYPEETMTSVDTQEETDTSITPENEDDPTATVVGEDIVLDENQEIPLDEYEEVPKDDDDIISKDEIDGLLMREPS